MGGRVQGGSRVELEGRVKGGGRSPGHRTPCGGRDITTIISLLSPLPSRPLSCSYFPALSRAPHFIHSLTFSSLLNFLEPSLDLLGTFWTLVSSFELCFFIAFSCFPVLTTLHFKNRLSLETSTFNNYHSEDSRDSGSRTIELSLKSASFLD